MGPLSRRHALLVAIACALPAPACDRGAKPTSALPPTAGNGPRKPEPLRDEIPPDRIGPVIQANIEGRGLMEQYKYAEAAEKFRKVRQLAPGWIPGSINLAIALLNDGGAKTEAAKNDQGTARGATKPAETANEPPPVNNLQEALRLLNEVISRDPANLHAHYCRGLILEYQGELPKAHADFRFVAEKDPNDGHTWYKVGSTMTNPDGPGRPSAKHVEELIGIYTKALKRNPYLVPALYKLQSAYALSGDRAKQKELLQLWMKLNPDRNVVATGDVVKDFYGDAGRYARIIDLNPAREPTATPPPRFETPVPLKVALPAGDRWVSESDFTGPLAVIGRARARFGAAVAALDADGDGRLDLFLAASVRGPKGVRDALLLNRGGGKFEDATAACGLGAERASLGVAAGDFDADGRLDLFLTGVGDNRLYRNVDGKNFQDVTESAGLPASTAISPTARWLDLDQDGDLDLYVINFTDRSHADEAFTDRTPPGLSNAAYRNDGQPAPVAGQPQRENWAPRAVAPADLKATAGLSIVLTPWPDAPALLGDDVPHTGLAALDLDDDRDMDLVLAADGVPPSAVLNDRMGKFNSIALGDLDPKTPIAGLLTTDLDRDGRADLVAVCPQGRVMPWRNLTARKNGETSYAFEVFPTDAKGWRSALAADLDLDGRIDLLGLPTADAAPAPAWARNEGSRLVTQLLSLGPEETGPKPLQGQTLADLVGDALPDLLIVRDGQGPSLARNLGNGQHWLALDLSGRWKTSNWSPMRTNPQGLGARLAVEGEGLNVLYDHTTPEAGLAQSVAPIVLGLGSNSSAALVRVRWPDGVMQCELNQPADQSYPLAELNRRKEGSCPVLFSWNGERFVCIADFLGGGGLGYLVAPGVFSEPDRDEAVAIAPEQLRAAGGVYRLAITEPMDEIAYLDKLVLDVVDRPAGVMTAPDERFVPSGARPSGDLLAWRTTIEPARATDLVGHDVTDVLRTWDRRTVDGFRRLTGWIGYAEEHGIVLDFGDRLGRFGAGDRLVLCLAGWVEYPYSQTNYAASTAGVALKPPVLERRRDDGTWEVIEANAGYPAGLPRLTTLDLTGKLTGPRCVLRLRTNMECYWDQAYVALREPSEAVRVTALPVIRAGLGYRGYTREVSPDGRDPLLYDYDHIDAAPLARFAGTLTRHGDVAELLRGDDDQLCLVGPGDEVRVEFDAQAAPALPEGWTRSFILRAIGYCKDADPFTAASDTVGPLPWRGMTSYPFDAAGKRPDDATYRAYLSTYQTRSTGLP